MERVGLDKGLTKQQGADATMDDESSPLEHAKKRLRAEARDRRRLELQRDAHSRAIWRQWTALPEFTRAATVLIYVDFRDEVQTRPFLPELLASPKRVIVPSCSGNDLELFHLKSLDDLHPGRFGILEPKPDLRRQAGRWVEPAQLDLLVVPGLAYDLAGNRLGYGRGYFDRLLSRIRSDAPTIGLAFACQLFRHIPTGPRDIPVQLIATDQAVHRC